MGYGPHPSGIYHFLSPCWPNHPILIGIIMSVYHSTSPHWLMSFCSSSICWKSHSRVLFHTLLLVQPSDVHLSLHIDLLVGSSARCCWQLPSELLKPLASPSDFCFLSPSPSPYLSQKHPLLFRPHQNYLSLKHPLLSSSSSSSVSTAPTIAALNRSPFRLFSS